MTDLRTAAAKLSKAVLDKASWLETMQLAGEVINALAQSDAGPFGAGRPVFLTEATPAPTVCLTCGDTLVAWHPNGSGSFPCPECTEAEVKP